MLGGGLTGLRAQWNVPQFTSTGTPDEEAVIGIQIGCWFGNSTSDCIRLFVYIVVTPNNTAYLTAFDYHTPSEVTGDLSLQVSPGDVVSASIEYIPSNPKPWTLTMTNQTQGGQHAQLLLSNSLSRSNAFFYVGNVGHFPNDFPLPHFGRITFQKAELRYSAGWVGINTLQYQSYELGQNTTTLLQVSPLNGESFTVTRLNP